MERRSVPPDTSEREKIIGGLLDIHQLCWLAGGVLILGVVPCILMKDTIGVPGLILFLIIGLAFGASFAFVKIKGLPLFSYLKYKMKFKKSIHIFTNQGELYGPPKQW